MRFTISWVYQGRGHYVHSDFQITSVMIARAVSKDLATTVNVYQGDTEVVSYRGGEVLS